MATHAPNWRSSRLLLELSVGDSRWYAVVNTTTYTLIVATTTMTANESLDRRIAARIGQMSPAEQRVARLFQATREEVLIASAAQLAKRARTSDATVVRTTRTLGFSGMEELRRSLAAEIRGRPSQAGRVAATLEQVGDRPGAALGATVSIHQESLERLQREVSVELFQEAVNLTAEAKRVVIFGIGPSGAIASYFQIQLERFGLHAVSFGRTGLLFADDLHTLRSGDLVVVLAYDRVYREVAALLRESAKLKLARILITDSLSNVLRRYVDLILPVARGRADMFSMHTATLGLVEALLVGIAAKRPDATLASLERLRSLRNETADRVGTAVRGVSRRKK